MGRQAIILMHIRHYVSFPVHTPYYNLEIGGNITSKKCTKFQPQLGWFVYGSSREVAQDVRKIMQMQIHQYVGTGVGS